MLHNNNVWLMLCLFRDKLLFSQSMFTWIKQQQ